MLNKELNKKNKIIIIFASIIFLTLLIFFVFLSYAIANHRFLTGDAPLKFTDFITSFKGLFIDKKQRGLFLIECLCGFLMFMFYIWTKITKPEKFSSNVMEITPDIKIPASAGEGQFGTAKFLDAKKKDKVFKSNIIDINNERMKKLIDTGDEDIKEQIKRLNEGVSINQIEQEFKEKEKRTKERKENEELDEEIKKFKEEIEQEREYDLQMNENEEDIINIMQEQRNDEWMNENIEEQMNEIDTEQQSEYLKEKYINEIKRMEEKNLQKEKKYDAKSDPNKFFEKGGLITGIYKMGNNEKINYIDKDTHSVIIGATRSGKSRCLVMQSIGNTALAGESIVVTDPKGELYAYTNKFMEKLGYEIICLDFKNPNNSSHYNLLQPIINAKNEGDEENVVKYAQELSNMLVQETKGENPLWTNGERALITGSILSLVLGQKDEDLMNLSSVYRFISNSQDKTLGNGQDMNLTYYIKALEEYKNTSPIINAFSSAIKGAKETSGSFFTSATATLNLYSQPSMWQITHKSNVNLNEMGERKQILYFILPDQDTSYYQIVSIIVKQMYNELVKVSDKYGGRLPIRVNFFLDEFGNFAKIPDLATLLTVAGGRGMRFNLFLQSFNQINQKYDKDTTEIVKSNCETWVYLKANDIGTLEEISKKLGKYTIYSNSESMSSQGTYQTNNSSSQSLQGRNLLMPEEIREIKRPYLLVMAGDIEPAILEAPDISKLYFNKMYGMGDELYNNQLRMVRDRQRPITKSNEEIKYWNLYRELEKELNNRIDLYTDSYGNKLEKPRKISDQEYIDNIVEILKEKEAIDKVA